MKLLHDLRTASRTRRRAAALLVGLFALSLPLVAEATSLAPLDVEQLSKHADVVVRGQVASAEARKLPSGRIVTFHRVVVREVLSGGLTESEREAGAVVVGVPGGVVGDMGQRVHGAPVLSVGDEVVLFLGRAGGPGGARGVVGMHQGVFVVGASGASGPSLVPGPAEGGAAGGVVAPPATMEELKARLGSGR